jgi:predicted metal-dependent enzyme (double-stranded beta helix superfamily)
MDEGWLVTRFAARINALGRLSPASPALKSRLLRELKTLARRLDGSRETGSVSGYHRRLLHEDPGGWSLALIILRPGQLTNTHNHAGWGAAATVQGIERERRFALGASGAQALRSERNYPPGTGYVFDSIEIHQPVGADPGGVTVALHFLVDGPREAAHG